MYATKQDIIDQEGEQVLYDYFDRGGDGVIDDAAVDRALARASALVDSCLGNKFVVPIVNVPALLVGYVVDLAIYYGSNGSYDELRVRHDDAIKWLKKVASGEINIGLPEIEQPEDNSSKGEVLTSCADYKVFNDKALENF